VKTIIFKVTSWRDMSLWRRIECTQAQTLHHLHGAIQSAFKLDDDHAYAFFLNNRPWDQVFDYSGPGLATTPHYATNAVLAELPLKINKRILYIFDFGDDLRYDVKVAGEGLADRGLSYPRVIDGEGEAPPQYQSLDEDDQEAQEEDIPKEIGLGGFVCLLAWDATAISNHRVLALARSLITDGCAYICCWGADCKRVHDLFVQATVEVFPNGPHVMTAWHKEERLDEALWFAMFNTYPDPELFDSCRSMIGISIGSKVWATEIRAAMADPRAFSARVVDSG